MTDTVSEKQPVTAIHIRLHPIRTARGLAPDPTVNREIYALSNEITPLLAPYCFALRRYLYQILFLCRTETPNAIQSVYHALKKIPGLIQQRNCSLEQSRATFRFQYAIAADFQYIEVVPIPVSDISPDPYLFPGMLIERTDKIIRNIPDELTNTCMITHALYENISPAEKADLPVCYYIMHICCYTSRQ